jgi:hypothetical protein
MQVPKDSDTPGKLAAPTKPLGPVVKRVPKKQLRESEKASAPTQKPPRTHCNFSEWPVEDLGPAQTL